MALAAAIPVSRSRRWAGRVTSSLLGLRCFAQTTCRSPTLRGRREAHLRRFQQPGLCGARDGLHSVAVGLAAGASLAARAIVCGAASIRAAIGVDTNCWAKASTTCRNTVAVHVARAAARRVFAILACLATVYVADQIEDCFAGHVVLINPAVGLAWLAAVSGI